MAKKRGEKESILRRISIGRIISIILTLIMIFILFSLVGIVAALIIGPVPSGNIAVIHIAGVITSEDRYGGGTSANQIIGFIKAAEENEDIKAILLDINSGGGSAVGSDEISQAVKSAEKPTVAVIREIGTSGAYWVASAADKIYANRMSVTGSIGVIASYLEFAKLLDDYNVTYRRLVSGRYKDIGSPFKEMTDEETLIFQQSIDKIHNFFVNVVAENRNLPQEKIREIATGSFMLGIEAKELGLVDELGTKEDAIAYIEQELNITADLADSQPRRTLYSRFSSMAENSMKGIAGIAGNTEQISVQT